MPGTKKTMQYKPSRIVHAWRHTRKRRVAAALLVLFLAFNGIVYLIYKDKTYPGTNINGQAVGSVRYGELPRRVQSLRLIPEKIKAGYGGTSAEVTVSSLGMRVDHEQTAQNLQSSRSWLPVANFFTAQNAPLFIAVEPASFQKKINEMGRGYRKSAANASLTLQSGAFVIRPEVEAQSIDPSGSQARIIDALSRSRTSVELMMRRTPPQVTRASLTPTLQVLEGQRNTAVTIGFQDRSRKLEPAEIGSWFTPGQGSFVLSEQKIADGISDAAMELGVNPDNADSVKAIVRQTIEARKPLTVTLTGKPLNKKAYSYCTAGRGVPETEVKDMTGKIDSVLNAKRGWSLGGNITFSRSERQCDFTIWLSAPAEMQSFGAICDEYWSCAVKPNVIFNHDRWRLTSEAWKKSNGSLDDYKSMVINHEVGHWLGFEHSTCPAAGAPAPVMQQQSIDLQGCTFNPWPSITERISLRNYLGL